MPDLVVIDPVVHHDSRGFLLETWHLERYREAGIPGPFVQDVHSHSHRGVLRGLHFQHPKAQGKIVHVPRGSVFDVTVDVRVGSPTFGRWWSLELSEENRRQLWIPPGFAHGFLTLSDAADVEYRCTNFFASEASRALAWDDPAVGVEWPIPTRAPSGADPQAPAPPTLSEGRTPTLTPLTLSESDAQALTLRELGDRGLLPVYPT